MSRLKTIRLPPLTGGIDYLNPPHLVSPGYASDGLNVTFGRGIVEKVSGYEKLVSSPLTGVVQNIGMFRQNDGSKFTMAITTGKCYKYNTTTAAFDDITGGSLTGSSSSVPTITTAFNKFYFTNGIDYPKYWDGSSGTIANVPGLDTSSGSDIEGGYSSLKSRIVRGFSGFLVFGNNLEDSSILPSRIRWSRFGDPTLWKNTAGGDGQAGYADVPGQDAIYALEQLRDFLVIYKENSIWIMQYVGLPGIFSFRRVVEGVGCSSPKGVVNVGNSHIFIGKDNIYSFDGVQVQAIGNFISDRFFEEMNQERLGLCEGIHVRSDYEAWFTILSTADSYPSRALILNYNTGAIGVRDLTATALGSVELQSDLTWESFGSTTWEETDLTWGSSSVSTAGELILMGDSSGYVYRMRLNNTEDGDDYEGYVTTGVLDFGIPEIVKRLHRIMPRVDVSGDYNLQIYVATLNNPMDDIVFPSSPLTLNLSGEHNPFVDCDFSARYFVIKFRTASGNQPFGISDVSLMYTTRGMH